MATTNITLCAFLGNPGRDYLNTRHNAGFLVAGSHPDLSLAHWQQKFHGEYLSVRSGRAGADYAALKPTGYMNRSGVAVSAAAAFFKLPPEAVLVVHDDIELPFGHIGFRRGGGLAGHNGLRDIADRTGSREFARLRVGVGRPRGGAVHSHVLGGFNSDEKAWLPEILAAACTLLDEALSGSVTEETRRELF